MAFSSGLSLADLSDYLAPSQACIMPVTEVPTTSKINLIVEQQQQFTEAEILKKKLTSAATEIMIDSENNYHEIKINELGDIRSKLKKAEITIEDCLACSGCVTSEESVLVAMQSDEEVYRVLREQPDLIRIISFSPQSLASLAALHDLTITETFRGLRAFFKRQLGFRLVFDITFARAISLSENKREFLERKSHASSSSSSFSSQLSSSTPSEFPLSPSTSSTGPLPILSSACPGWICLAEKKHGELLPFVSNVKSAQAVMGTLIKYGEVAQRLNLKPSQIYHVSVMPCFDKKLEASRLDFSTPHDPLDSSFVPATTMGIRDVDCVLTTGEVQKMLNSNQISLSTLAHSLEDEDEESEKANDISGIEENSYMPEMIFNSGTSSGGYLFNTIEAVLNSLSKEELYCTKMIEKKLKNEDHISYTLITSSSPSTSTIPITSSSTLSSTQLRSDSMDIDLPSPSTSSLVSTTSSISPSTSTSSSSSPPKVLLRAAKCYGLHNLQNLTRKVTTDASITPIASTSSSSAKMLSNRSLATSRVAASNAKRLAAKKLLTSTSTSSISSSNSTNGGKIVVVVEKEVEEINYDGLKYDYVEIMACPSGCVNGGGQIRIPLEPMKINRLDRSVKSKTKKVKRVRLDHEGMPDFGERLLSEENVEDQVDDEEEEDELQDEEMKKVFTGKEWVSRVEEVYWEIGTQEENQLQNQLQQKQQRRNQDQFIEFDWNRIDNSIQPYLINKFKNLGIESLINLTIEGLLKGVSTSEEKEEKRRNLLRTSYRAVEGQTNGFAVQW